MVHTTSHVLLVDDNKEAVDMFSELLSLHHIQNKVAYDGPSAIALLSAWPVDLVFLDIRMPGMDGYATAMAMHALPGYAELPIVAWTAWNSRDSEETLRGARMVGRLSKPVSLEDILRLIDQYAPKRNQARR